MGKGSQYERDVCYKLSEWWTGKKDSSVFWRTSMSGGRATVRQRKGKQTTGHYGDICVTHPSAEKLMRLVTIEVKRGYNKDSMFNLLDKQSNRKPSGFEEWLLQASKAAYLADSEYWMIIARRSQKQAMIYFPMKLWYDLTEDESMRDFYPFPFVSVACEVKVKNKLKPFVFVGMLFEEFLAKVPVKIVRNVIAKL